MRWARVVLVATAVFAGWTTAAGAASPALEISSSKNAIPVGTEFGADVPGLHVTTNLGTVKCLPEKVGGQMRGFLRSNLGHSDSMEMTTVNGYIDGEQACESTVPFGPTAYFAFDHSGHIGTLTVSAKSKELLASETGVNIGLFFPSANVECFYTFKTLKGHNNDPWSEKPNYLYFEFSADKLKFDKAASSQGCPSKATLTFSLTPFFSVAQGFWEGATIG
jgi:hypothetical protein